LPKGDEPLANGEDDDEREELVERRLTLTRLLLPVLPLNRRSYSSRAAFSSSVVGMVIWIPENALSSRSESSRVSRKLSALWGRKGNRLERTLRAGSRRWNSLLAAPRSLPRRLTSARRNG